MVSVEIRKGADGRYFGYACRGHADYGEEGSDIVCAAVSILSINTANAIETLTACRIEVTETEKDRGILTVMLPEGSDDKAALLMEAYEMGIRGIRDNYGQYVSLEIAGT